MNSDKILQNEMIILDSYRFELRRCREKKRSINLLELFYRNLYSLLNSLNEKEQRKKINCFSNYLSSDPQMVFNVIRSLAAKEPPFLEWAEIFYESSRDLFSETRKKRIENRLKISKNNQIAKEVDIEDLELLSNFKIEDNDFSFERFGSSFDGGYVCADLSGGYDYLISGGVCDNLDFEKDFLNIYNISGVGFDIDLSNSPRETPSALELVEKKICKKNSDSSTNLKNEIASFKDVFLKMDIEGWEFDWLNSLTEKELSRIKQIVIEIHNLDSSKKIKSFLKLKESHNLVHVHSNNNAYMVRINNESIPSVFECTFVRKGEVGVLGGNTAKELDSPCCRFIPELGLENTLFLKNE